MNCFQVVQGSNPNLDNTHNKSRVQVCQTQAAMSVGYPPRKWKSHARLGMDDNQMMVMVIPPSMRVFTTSVQPVMLQSDDFIKQMSSCFAPNSKHSLTEAALQAMLNVRLTQEREAAVVIQCGWREAWLERINGSVPPVPWWGNPHGTYKWTREDRKLKGRSMKKLEDEFRAARDAPLPDELMEASMTPLPPLPD